MKKSEKSRNTPGRPSVTGVSETQAWIWGLLSLTVLALSAYTIIAGV